jgi:hypothetical protein
MDVVRALLDAGAAVNGARVSAISCVVVVSVVVVVVVVAVAVTVGWLWGVDCPG